MNINKNYHPNQNLLIRIWDHASFGLKRDIGNREKTPPNLIEKLGDAVLWTVGLIPRTVTLITNTFKDPRIATIVFTAIGLLVTSFIFYPSITFALSKTVVIFSAQLIAKIPFWAVKFSSYLSICTAIMGAGLRAEGRFMNRELMKEFYQQPEEIIPSVQQSPTEFLKNQQHKLETNLLV